MKNNQIKSARPISKTKPKKYKSMLEALKYAVSLPYVTNSVDLVKKNR